MSLENTMIDEQELFRQKEALLFMLKILVFQRKSLNKRKIGIMTDSPPRLQMMKNSMTH